jgi:hypothetical protein
MVIYKSGYHQPIYEPTIIKLRTHSNMPLRNHENLYEVQKLNLIWRNYFVEGNYSEEENKVGVNKVDVI